MSDTSRIELPNDQDSSGRSLGIEELENLLGAIKSGTLTATKGNYTKTLNERFAKHMGTSHAYACSSGTMAIHCAISAIDPEPGDEIITTPVTDMGALTPIVYQGAIPVFADVDRRTGNLTAETIRQRISDKTRAIVVTHLFGNPCEMGPIMALANERGIPVIEDCAQAYETTWNGQRVGTFGAIGCFSLQQGKHITTGEGGLVVTNDDSLGRRVRLFIDKAWGYGDPKPDHYFLALNGRMTELQGAVALAQLDKLEAGVAARIARATELNEALAGLDGISTPHVPDGGVHTYWKYCLWVDPEVIEGGPVGLASRLRQDGIFSAPRYIQKPAFKCQVFSEQRTFGQSQWPFTLARREALDYSEASFQGTWAMLNQVLVLPINEKYQPEHVELVADVVRAAHDELT